MNCISLKLKKRRIKSRKWFGIVNRFACPACMKKFVHQQVVAVKECGHVLCSECFKKFVGSSKQCYVCQASVVKKKDFIPLESGGTGFSSHNKVDVKVYKPIEN